MNGPIVDLTGSPIAPGTTPKYLGQLQDEVGNPLAGGVLSSLQLTICDTTTKVIINAVQDVNILNADRGTIDGLGNLVVSLKAADTPLIDPTNMQEYRSLILIWKWNSGASVGAREVRFVIDALSGA